ncbi:hypothetical protein C8R44DRAFT_892231 [Mycena epipterygia]|nr:hypothetical protein C8R44DRAFT_892231 [Mycena epipterygia]
MSTSRAVENRKGNMESRYIFYRFYSPSSAIVSRNAFDAADPFLGRIKLIAVASPRTVDSLKRFLAQSENLNDPANERTDLYSVASSDSPIRNGNLHLMDMDLGSSPQLPVAFVLRQDLSDAEKASVGGIHIPDNFRISPGVLEGRRRSHSRTETEMEPRYIYYRVYTPERAIRSLDAFHPKDSFLGRIDVTRIPPPHTVATLSQCLANAEKLSYQHVYPLIFLTAASQYSMPGTQKISILGRGPGSVPEEALALVLLANPGGRSQRRPEGASGGNVKSTQYLYYRLHNRDGETVSKTAFDPDDRAVGRIDRIHVTPPHTAYAIRRCIAKVEGNPRYIYGTLYPDSSNTMAIPDDAHLSLLSSRGGLGISTNSAVVLVEQERREGVFNRPMRCMVFMDRASKLPGWLRCARGQVVFTDGILRDAGQSGGRSSTTPLPAYIAVTAKRHRGFISPGSFRFLDELLPDTPRGLHA